MNARPDIPSPLEQCRGIIQYRRIDGSTVWAHASTPPAKVGTDALWVHGHRGEVRLLMWAALAAVALSILPLRHPDLRWPMVAAWAIALLLVVAFFGERAVVIATVLIDQKLMP